MSLHQAYELAFNALNADHVVTPDIERKLADALIYAFMTEAALSSSPDPDVRGLAQTGLDHFLHLYGSGLERVVVE